MTGEISRVVEVTWGGGSARSKTTHVLLKHATARGGNPSGFRETVLALCVKDRDECVARVHPTATWSFLLEKLLYVFGTSPVTYGASM